MSNMNQKPANTPLKQCPLHEFTESNIELLRIDLLKWYQKCQRKLPWRDIAKSSLDSNQIGYAVWISEVMLQQTQVCTVIKYYNRWMEKWPTVEDLAAATLEEVNQVWAGLGYYSRARSLHEGAQHISQNMNGQMPRESCTLMKNVKGVGKYTAAAIASIAFGQVVGLVDGNVSRVLSRLRLIGSDITKQHTASHLWHLADVLVDRTQPGDFNQAVMELGATVCTSKNPSCSKCPLQKHCLAYQKKYATNNQLSLEEDIEDCSLCLPRNLDNVWTSQGICAYPQKAAKKPSRREQHIVVVLQESDSPVRYFMVRRPKKGLLAGLWEFPNFVSCPDQSEKQLDALLVKHLKEDFQLSESSFCERTFHGEVVHIFSHIHATYQVFQVTLKSQQREKFSPKYLESCWLSHQELSSSAVPTAMKKILAQVLKKHKSEGSANTSSPRKRHKKNESNPA